MTSLVPNINLERATFDAPYVRRIFSSSPRDPRYHMLQHLSPKFQNAPNNDREPRAALVLNRFTRTLAVMFATESIAAILGVTAAQLAGKSFYECIDEGCLPAAMRCLESAKANDSIAYLRFWSRDPCRPEDVSQEPNDEQRAASSSPESIDGGVPLPSERESVPRHSDEPVGSSSSEGRADSHGARIPTSESFEIERAASQISSDHNSSHYTSGTDPHHDDSMFEEGSRSSTSSLDAGPNQHQAPIELEAVVSCTSDGLVVILRRARPIIPATVQTIAEMQQGQGMFVAPWGAYQDMQPHAARVPNYAAPPHIGGWGIASAGPSIENIMRSIRDVAVFAWSLVGINGNIAAHAKGKAVGEAMPPGGVPIWEPHAIGPELGMAPHNQAQEMWDPWNGRLVPKHQPRPQPQHTQSWQGHHGHNDGYRYDDLAPSAIMARADVWRSRQGDSGSRDFGIYDHGHGQDHGGFKLTQQPVARLPLPVPSIQQFNADADHAGSQEDKNMGL